MENLLAKLPKSQMPSQTSGLALQTIAAKLDTTSESPWWNVSLVEAEAIINAPLPHACGPEAGINGADQLLGFYRKSDLIDPKTYVAGLSKLLSVYPKADVAKLIDPVEGLASMLKWLPTLAECRAFLDAIATRRANIIATAHVVARYHRQREESAKADAKWKAEQASLTPERRAAIHKRMLQLADSLRAKQDEAA